MYGIDPKSEAQEKEKIIREFLPVVRYTAYRLAWRLPPQISVDDLISVGLNGLYDAMERYEAGKVKLKTYAQYRIKGAMLDELRSLEWVPRSKKKKINHLKKRPPPTGKRTETESGRRGGGQPSRSRFG